MHSLSIFVSHSFASDHFGGDLKGFRDFVKSAVEKSLKKSGPIAERSVAPKLFFDSREYGEGLNDTIVKQLKASDVIIADITGTRPNVLYELGYAQALGATLVMIQNHAVEIAMKSNFSIASDAMKNSGREPIAEVLQGLATSPIIPSDLQGMIVGVYSSISDVEDLLLERLTSIIVEFAGKIETGTIEHVPRCFWFNQSVEEITVVCAPEDDEEKGPYASEASDNYIFVDNLEDRDAVLEVNKFLSRSFPESEIYTRGCSLRGLNVSRTNLVIIGGPLNNSVARQFMQRLNLNLDYKIPLECPSIELLSQQGQSLSIDIERSEDGLLVKDVGYFGWFRNPLKRACHVVLCQGFQTWGTLAATRVFSDESTGRKNRSLLNRRIQESDLSTLEEVSFIEAFFSVPILEDRQADVPDLSLPETHLIIG